MNLLSHSNGIYKLQKEKINIFVLIKRIIAVILIIIMSGFIIQKTVDIIDETGMKSKFKYVRIDGKKLEYKVKGSGDYTVIMDGNIGNTMFQWDNVSKLLEDDNNVQIFVYNRRGYGFNDGGSARTPKEQAEDLKAVLKKTGVNGPYILVGEEYGSLVMTNFANEYPDLVAGMVLIDPISENSLSDKTIKKEIRGKYYRSKIESLGANFMFTSIIDKMGLALENEYFENNISESKLEEFNKFKNKKNYRQAVSNELSNLYNGSSSGSQKDGMLENKSLYVISQNENDELIKIGDSEYTKIYTHKKTGNVFSMADPEAVVNGINIVLKDVKKINKQK